MELERRVNVKGSGSVCVWGGRVSPSLIGRLSPPLNRDKLLVGKGEPCVLMSTPPKTKAGQLPSPGAASFLLPSKMKGGKKVTRLQALH